MGRPADQFCWDNVDKLPNSRWRCKHCKEEFSGAASRIRIHLSGSGNDIGSCEIRRCEAVPSHVREEALKRALKKRRRSLSSGEGNDGISATNRTEVAAAPANNSLDMATALQVSSFNGDLSTHTKKGSEKDTADSLVKFFMSRNLPIDVFKHPDFRNFLRAAQNCFPPWLFQNDLIEIQRSVWNLEYEVNQHLSKVKESWKTTGFTLIRYNLSKGLETVNDVYGFYCPKGFIFLERQQLDLSNGLLLAWENHLLNLPIEEFMHEIYHSGPSSSGCEFGVPGFLTRGVAINTYCAREIVQLIWMRICRETRWVHNLIRKSEKVYQYMLNSDKSYRCEGWRKLMVEKVADATPRSSFTRLRSIMQLEDGIKRWLSDFPEYRISRVGLGVGEIINSNKFWSDGKELLEALTPLFRIIDLLDTLVPTAGYLHGVVEKVKHALKPYYDREVSKYKRIWKSLDSLTLDHKVAAYFSPIYDWRAIEGSLDPDAVIKEVAACCITSMDVEDVKKLLAESKVYRDKNPFANLPPLERECNHPVTLWNKYGGEFPMLRKYAIKILSKPTSCMCKQVKKHITHLQGQRNFILRLNYHMWQEFTELGDRIYKPLERQYYCSSNTPILNPLDEVPANIPKQMPNLMAPSFPKKMVDGPHIGQIPEWMNEFISKSTNVIDDGNCGYRAIAESLGLGQDKWYDVRQKLYDELTSQPQLYARTFVHGNVRTILKALEYNGTGFVPPETWLEVTDMGLLVASTFKAMFVVMGPTILCTYLPLYLPEGCPFLSVPEIAVCLISESSHFTSLSLMENAPLPHLPTMWFSHHHSSTEGFDRFLSDRLTSYKEAEARHKGEMSPIEIIVI